MNTRASFVLVMAVVVGLPACAREQQRQSAQTAGAWSQQPPSGTYGAEDPEARIEAQRRGAETDLTIGAEAEEEARMRRMESEMESLDTSAAQQEAELQRRLAEACPVSVPGAEVTSREVPNGVALVFTTDDDVDELRTRVDRFAQLHNEQSIAPMPGAQEQPRQPGMHGGMHGGTQGGQPGTHGGTQGGMQHGMEGAPHDMQHGSVASRAEVEEIDRGAQIILTPRDPSQLEALRQETQQEAQQMAGGECPMMMGG